MRLSHSLILAGALVVAVPAVAQDNAAAPANIAATNATDVNAAAPAPAAPMTATENAPPSVATPADTGTTLAVKPHRGFPWGVLGLLGLVGLLGVRKVKA
jgi:hypothetical protein